MEVCWTLDLIGFIFANFRPPADHAGPNRYIFEIPQTLCGPRNHCRWRQASISKFYDNVKATDMSSYSAGATISLCLASTALSASPPLLLPSKFILISPAVNLAMDNPSMKKVAPNDPMLTVDYCIRAGRLWAGLSNPSAEPSVVASLPMPESILSDPHMNPIAADLSKLASCDTKLIILSGTWDVLHPDILRFVDKCEREGIGAQTTFIQGDDMVHVFPVVYDLIPEAREATESIVSLVNSL